MYDVVEIKNPLEVLNLPIPERYIDQPERHLITSQEIKAFCIKLIYNGFTSDYAIEIMSSLRYSPYDEFKNILTNLFTYISATYSDLPVILEFPHVGSSGNLLRKSTAVNDYLKQNPNARLSIAVPSHNAKNKNFFVQNPEGVKFIVDDAVYDGYRIWDTLDRNMHLYPGWKQIVVAPLTSHRAANRFLNTNSIFSLITCMLIPQEQILFDYFFKISNQKYKYVSDSVVLPHTISDTSDFWLLEKNPVNGLVLRSDLRRRSGFYRNINPVLY